MPAALSSLAVGTSGVPDEQPSSLHLQVSTRCDELRPDPLIVPFEPKTGSSEVSALPNTLPRGEEKVSETSEIKMFPSQLRKSPDG